ncbi:MAG: SdrD B-like domain-containing protein [Phototrophicaceae bacterium]
MIRKLFFAVIVAVLLASVATAQTSSGQLCVRAFEDRNGNGTQDPNEPPIVRGISATLAVESGLIVDTGLMEASSSASSGTLCFQRLAAGQYRIRVASADYLATTPNDFTAAVSDSGVPQVLSYGGQFIPVNAVTVDDTPSQDERLQSTLAKSVVGGLGALIVMGAMTVIGALIYFFALRNRQAPRTGAYRPVPQTGQYPVAPSTGQYAAVPQNTPPTGSHPALMDDTDMPPVTTVADTYDMYSDDDDDTNKPESAQRVNHDPYVEAPDDDFSFDDEDDSLYRPPSE